MVFPEYGITGFIDAPKMARENVYPFMEVLPDCYNGTCKLCCQKSATGQEIQNGVACIAKQSKMYVQANMIAARPCEVLKDHNCPYDNHYLFNTNIIFNPAGCMIAKYHKEHLVEEEPIRLDTPRENQHVTFDTEYGRFGTAVCADGLYKLPMVSLVEDYQIDHLLFSSAWGNAEWWPIMQPMEWQYAMAARYNISVIAANTHEPSESYTGSGIYRSQSALNYTWDESDPLKSTMLTAELPVLSKRIKTRHLPTAGDTRQSAAPTGQAIPKPDGTITIVNDTYNVRILKGDTGGAEVCYGTHCCRLKYARNNTQELYVLGSYAGVQDNVFKLRVESCLVLRCPTNDLKSCGRHVEMSKTSFSIFELESTFITEYVFPNILPMSHAYDKLDWKFIRPDRHSNVIKSSGDWPLMAAALIGMGF